MRTSAMLRRSLVLLLSLLGSAACGQAASGGWTFAPGQSAPPAAAAAPSAAASQTTTAAAGGAVLGTIAVEAFDLGFKPATITVDKAGTYEVTFKNTGSIIHNITFADGTKVEANAGQTATGTVSVPDAGITFICHVPGHRD